MTTKITDFPDLPQILNRQDADAFPAERADGTNGRMTVGTLLAGLGQPGAAGTGMPTFAAANANIAYDPAANQIGGPLNNFVGGLPSPSMVAIILPSDIDRKAEALTMRLNTTPGSLRTKGGEIVTAGRLTPGCAHIMIYAATIGQLRYTFLDPLGPRPSDYVISAVDSVTDAITAAYVDAPTLANAVQVSAAGEGAVRRPFAPAGLPRTLTYSFVGVPADTPDVAQIREPLELAEDVTSEFARIPGTVAIPDGTLYKWWRRSYSTRYAAFTTSWVIRQRYTSYSDAP